MDTLGSSTPGRQLRAAKGTDCYLNEISFPWHSGDAWFLAQLSLLSRQLLNVTMGDGAVNNLPQTLNIGR